MDDPMQRAKPSDLDAQYLQCCSLVLPPRRQDIRVKHNQILPRADVGYQLTGLMDGFDHIALTVGHQVQVASEARFMPPSLSIPRRRRGRSDRETERC